MRLAHNIYLINIVFLISNKRRFYDLKEYYEIVGESRPLSAFITKHADFFTEMHF